MQQLATAENSIVVLETVAAGLAVVIAVAVQVAVVDFLVLAGSTEHLVVRLVAPRWFRWSTHCGNTHAGLSGLASQASQKVNEVIVLE